MIWIEHDMQMVANLADCIHVLDNGRTLALQRSSWEIFMSATIINLIIQIIAGAIGGSAVGAASKDVNLGAAGNTIASRSSIQAGGFARTATAIYLKFFSSSAAAATRIFKRRG